MVMQRLMSLIPLMMESILDRFLEDKDQDTSQLRLMVRERERERKREREGEEERGREREEERGRERKREKSKLCSNFHRWRRVCSLQATTQSWLVKD